MDSPLSYWCDVCGGRFGPEALHLSSPRHVLTLNRDAASRRIPEPPRAIRDPYPPAPPPTFRILRGD